MTTVNDARKRIKLPALPIPREELVTTVGAVTNKFPTQPTSAPPPLPVASVLGMLSYPITSIYPPNDSSVLAAGDSDLSRDSNNSVRAHVPFLLPHLVWDCAIDSHDTSSLSRIHVSALIDHGSPPVLIDQMLVDRLHLPTRLLPRPFPVSGAFFANSENSSHVSLTHWVKLKLHDRNNLYSARTVRAIVAPNLCHEIILGLPFLSHNRIVVDAHECTAIDGNYMFDLLHPIAPVRPKCRIKLRDLFNEIKANCKLLVQELKKTCMLLKPLVDARCEQVNGLNIIGAIRVRIEQLAAEQELEKLDCSIKTSYADVFKPIPHVDEMPNTVLCKINLKDATKTIDTRNYSCPRKFRDVWSTLIQQHLDAGRIRPSSSAHASPAFLVPKADAAVLPRWVNDYRQLNANTVTDSHPLPRVDDILADAGRGKIWSKLDMTDSFFHTKMDPESVHLTAVTTPLGLYEWLVMPQGLRNAPPVHQRHVTAALRPFLGIFAHIYLDDIIIWSLSIEEHTMHIKMIMDTLRKARLYCNAKKSKFYLTELIFLGHRISQRGIEACSSKVDKILSWPTPKTATDVRSFLGLVRYISAFLPHLAEHTAILTPLTTKDCEKIFPEWCPAHQEAFDAIKALVVSRECLTVIDHTAPGNNRIFVTCDASDLRTGAVLSWGPTWETARPVAFDSMQLKDAQKNYPVHEKEMLAIVRALKKWRSDLLGSEFIVYTDHRTLENFESQKDLSRRQARWMEHLSQFDMSIHYICGEDNTVADALSWLPLDNAEDAPDDIDVADSPLRLNCWLNGKIVCNATLAISMDQSFLDNVREGYSHDDFCQKLSSVDASIPGIRCKNGLWYLGDRLVIPRFGTLREDLFRLAHDSLGHFGADKSYANIRNDYYWPNMHKDLETAYIPACPECQRNKSATSRPKGPLHPLPVPEAQGDSVCLDFVGPLPENEGYNCVLTITDRLGSDVRLIPTRTDISAPRLAAIFFNEWYCENGLPLELISDRDKLFISKF
jgi:hypothetical protein